MTPERIESLKAAGFSVFADAEVLLDCMEHYMKDLPPHLKRVKIEKEQLDAKIRKLERFLENGTVKVTPREFDIMTRQLVVMDALSVILQERLDIGKPSDG